MALPSASRLDAGEVSMIVGFISDIHGNVEALNVCLRHLSNMAVDRLLFLGDAVGYLPYGKEVVARLISESVECQKGNHESMLLEPTRESAEHDAIYGLERERSNMDGEMLEQIFAWPETQQLEVEGVRILLVHGSPEDPLRGYIYHDTDLSAYENLSFDAVFMGNTHRPFVRWCGSTLFANVGSSGLPRDSGNMASFALYDAKKGECKLYRVPFDTSHVINGCDALIHEDIRACLTRRTPDIVGEILG